MSCPRSHEPAVDALDEDRVAAALEQMRLGYLECAEALPGHGEFVARCCDNDGVKPFNFATGTMA